MPYIIAIGAHDFIPDDIDVANALFGSEQVAVRTYEDSALRPSRRGRVMGMDWSPRRATSSSLRRADRTTATTVDRRDNSADILAPSCGGTRVPHQECTLA